MSRSTVLDGAKEFDAGAGPSDGCGYPTRDFTFVKDTAAAFLAVGTASATAVVGEELNAGTGTEVSIGDLVDEIARLMGRHVTVVEDAARMRPKDSEVMRTGLRRHQAAGAHRLEAPLHAGGGAGRDHRVVRGSVQPRPLQARHLQPVKGEGTTMHAVILAGGKGTRLRPYTTCIPKPLVPVGHHSIIEIVMRQLSQCGFENVTVALGHLGHLIRAYCGDGTQWGLSIDYAVEESPLSTVGPLSWIASRPISSSSTATS